MQQRRHLSMHVPARLAITAGAVAAIAFAASCGDQQVTEPPTTITPVAATAGYVPTSSGCQSFQVTLGTGNTITVDSVSLYWCGGLIKGSLRPVLSGTPTFDRASGTVRIPIVLRNSDTTSVMALMRTLTLEDSTFIVTPTGIKNWGTGGPYVHFTNWESTTGYTRGGEWQFNPLRAGTIAQQYLPPKSLSTVKWLQMHVLSNVQKYQFMLWSTAPMAPSSKIRFVLDSGVLGHANIDTTVSRGSAIPYALTVASGFARSLVTDNEKVVALSGTIIADTDHTLYAIAQRPLIVTPQIQPFADEAHALLTAPDPVAAFQSLLTHALTLDAQVGDAEATRQLNIAYSSAIDPFRDSAALRRINATLNGHQFVVEPAADPSVSPSRASASPLREHDGILRDVAPGVSSDSAEPTTYLYVNGMYTGITGLVQTLPLLNTLRAEVPELHTSRAKLAFLYSATALEPATETQKFAICNLIANPNDGISDFDFAMHFSACMQTLTAPQSNDKIEVARQYANSVFGTAALEADALRLAAMIDSYHEGGQHVIVIAHSQGNMMAQQAIRWMLDNHKYDVQKDSACIGVMALASPVSLNWPVNGYYLKHVSVQGDLVAALSLWPQTPTPLSAKAAADIGRFTPGSYQYVQARWKWGTKYLHAINSSYLLQAVTRKMIQDSLTSLYHECAVGKVTQGFTVDNLQVGQSRLVAPWVQVFNRNTRPIYGRKLLWFSSAPSIASVDTTGTWKALAVGSAKIVSRSWQDTASLSAHVNLAPPRYPSFIGHYAGTWQSRQFPSSRGNADMFVTGDFSGTITYTLGIKSYSAPFSGNSTPFIAGVQYGTATFSFFSPEFTDNIFCIGTRCPMLGTFHFDDTYVTLSGQTVGNPGQPVDSRDWSLYRVP